MIKTKQVFFWTSNLKGYGFHGDKATILHLTLKYYSLSVLSEKLYFLEIGPVNQKLWPFKYMMLKTLNSNFLDWEYTLRNSGLIFPKKMLCYKKLNRLYSVCSLCDDIVENICLFWGIVKKNLTFCAAKTVWKALLFVPAYQIYMTFSSFSCCIVKCLKLHFHSSFPLYSKVPYLLWYITSDF